MNPEQAAQQRFEQAVFDYSKIILEAHLRHNMPPNPIMAHNIMSSASTLAETLENHLDAYARQQEQTNASDAQI